MKKLMILLLLPTFAIADPGLVTQHFKNEQATLFDLGMFRLEIWATQYDEHLGATYKIYSQSDPHTVSMHASYDADEDMIYVVAWIMDEQATEEQMEVGCRDVLRMMRINTSKVVWRLFAHYGAERDPAIQPMIHELYDQVELRCWITGRSTSEGRFWATSPLQGDFGGADHMKIGKWKMKNE